MLKGFNYRLTPKGKSTLNPRPHPHRTREPLPTRSDISNNESTIRLPRLRSQNTHRGHSTAGPSRHRLAM
jgi:hypothetical protein